MEKKRSSLIPYLIFTLFIALFVGFNIYAYKTMDSTVGFINEFGMLVIFTAFFVFVYLYVLANLIVTEYLPQKNDVVCLFSIDGRTAIFIDRKGKKYIYEFKHADIVKENIGKYFEVEKNIFSITKINNLTTSNMFEITDIKEKYWFNFYCYLGSFEEIFLLPIVYVAVTPFVLSAILTPFPVNLIILAMTIPLIFIILYDLAYKIKRKRYIKKILEEKDPIKRSASFNNINELQEFQKMWSFSILSMDVMTKLVTLVVTLGLTIFFIILCINTNGIVRLIMLPFALVIFGLFIRSLVDFIVALPSTKTEEELERKYILADKISYIVNKVCSFSFLAYWFGILVIGSITAIKDGELSILVSTIPFWIVGIAMLIKEIRS